MKIFGLLEDLMGCGFHRIQAPLFALKDRGHEVIVSHRPPKTPHYFDILQTQKFAMPELMPMWRALKKQGRPKLVIDMDDDLLNLPAWNQAKPFYSIPEIRANLIECLGTADLVTVSSPHLAELYKRHNDNIVVLPNYLPKEVIRPARLNRPFQLGWTGGQSHDRDLDSIAVAVNGFLTIEEDQTFTILGQDYTHKFKRSKWYPWEPYEGYINRIRAKLSVGIAVVDDDPFNKGKSDIKLLEYGIAGALPVYSRKPPYLSPRVAGVAVGDSVQDWVNAFLWILDNPEKRLELASMAYDMAKGQSHALNYMDRLEAYERLLA